MASIAQVLLALIFSLLFSSMALSYFVTEMHLSGNVPQIELPESLRSYNAEQNFASGTYDLGVLKHSGSSEWHYYENLGLTLIKTSGDTSYLYFDYVIPSASHSITNYYTINNTGAGEYSIVLVGKDGLSCNEVIVKADGFHIPRFSVIGIYDGSDKDFIPYPNPTAIQDVNIKTEFTEGYKNCPFMSVCEIERYPSLTFTFNDYSFTTDKLNIAENTGINKYYAGVAGWTTGLTIHDYKTDNVVSGAEKTSNDPLAYVSSFIDTMLKIVLWNLPENMLPSIVNILLIKTQLFGILICVVLIIRGVS